MPTDEAAQVLRILDYMRERRPDITDLIQTLVEIESPTGEKAGVDRVADEVAGFASRFASVRRYPQPEYGDHLRLELDIPSQGKGQILGLGHMDTVWKVGTLARMPWREEEGRLWGPGVFDMKSGLVYMLFAALALRDLDLKARRRFVVQLVSDEEVGSPTSTPLTRAEAGRSAAVIVAEPSAGLAGDVKTARKGGGTYRIEACGVASHAGLDFGAGASAVLEIAEQIRRIASWTDLERGLTVNPGVVRGGTASNVVAERARVDVDVRIAARDQAQEIDRRFHRIEALDPRCEVRVTGGIRKTPLERTEDVVRLYELARSISEVMGVGLGEASVGGGSDGNTTAAMGIPTLDGLGAVGEGAHATYESILIDRIADRAALIAALVLRL